MAREEVPEAIMDERSKFGFTLEIRALNGLISVPFEPLGRFQVRTWDAACNLLNEITYSTPKGDVTILTNWRAARNRVEQIARFECLSNEDKLRFIKEMSQPDRNPLRISFEVHASSSAATEEAQQNFARYVLELYLHEFFLAMNLAAPTCCDFYGSRILETQNTHSIELELNAAYFDPPEESSSSKLPPITTLPLDQVIQWIQAINMGTRQIAKTRTERAIFALLHLCKKPKFDPDGLIWISHALEALYDTPGQGIIQSLKQRATSVLGIPLPYQRQFRKQLSNFYELRSRYVHGSMEIAHPLENEQLDPDASSYRTNLTRAIDFGARVLISTLQAHVLNKWREIVFEEHFRGKPL